MREDQADELIGVMKAMSLDISAIREHLDGGSLGRSLGTLMGSGTKRVTGLAEVVEAINDVGHAIKEMK